MMSALLFSIPVAWIYTLTHKKKGWKQGTVQSLVVLPVVIAGIVVLLKYSLAARVRHGGDRRRGAVQEHA